ncbi:protein-L-isoaspartate(D-aspartate) O-methyltransferase [Nanoarchaeota archaeon]
MFEKSELIQFWKINFKFKEKELEAFEEINREDFVTDELKGKAYKDVPLPILRGKTISQPTTVMIMTSLLNLKEGEKVLEVGTGSGYQAAIIAKIIGPKGKVISTEVVPELVNFARENLKKANLKNVKILEEDGSKGCKKEAPFDKVIITAACKEFPHELIDQMKENGIIVGPVGDKHQQELVRGIKEKGGKLSLEFFGPFLFSPMYGKYGFED